MSGKKCAIKLTVFSIFILVVIGLIGTPLAQAQYWQALPPYNLLWPLWSPLLSPVDTLTNLPVPLLSQLTNSTILPVQPVLAWDPAQALPWALYNIPPVLGGGLSYFSPFFGINPFPPPYLLDSAGLPLPLTLPVGFGALSPTSVSSGIDIVTLGNIQYLLEYPTSLFGIPQSSLLTVGDIWGLPPI